jgi:hypothetical protein
MWKDETKSIDAPRFSPHKFSRNLNSLGKVLWAQILRNFKPIRLKTSPKDVHSMYVLGWIIVFTKPTSLTFTVPQEYKAEIFCNKLHPKRSRNAESISRKSFTTISKVWPLLCRLLRNSCSTNNILQELLAEFHENSTHSSHWYCIVCTYRERQTDTLTGGRGLQIKPFFYSVRHVWKHKHLVQKVKIICAIKYSLLIDA